MTAGDHKSQHWLPSSYTAAWLDRSLPKRLGQRIYLYSAEGHYLKWTHPRRAFTAEDLYTRRGPKGERDLSTEHHLSRIESDFARLRARTLEKRKEPSAKELATMAFFVAGMRSRSPREFERVNSFWKQVVRVGDNLKRQIERASKEERERLTRIQPLRGEKDRSFSLEVAREIAEWPIVVTLPQSIAAEAPILAKMAVAILTVPTDGPPLISSDAPISWWVPGAAERPRITGVGLGEKDVELTMPISPRQSLLFTNKSLPRYVDVDADGAVELNARTLSHCKEVWIANSPDLSLDWISSG